MFAMLIEGFNALLKIHGTAWKFGQTEFSAIAQAGAYAAYNFADGNTAITILQCLASALPALPVKGDIIESAATGNKWIVQRSKRVDANFLIIEIDGEFKDLSPAAPVGDLETPSAGGDIEPETPTVS